MSVINFYIYISYSESVDYIGGSSRGLVFGSGTVARSILCDNFTIVDDNVRERSEFFCVKLTTTHRDVVVNTRANKAVIEIVDNDNSK